MPTRYPPNPKYKNLSKKAALQLAAEDAGSLVGYLFSREMENRSAKDRITEGYPEAPKYKKGGNLKQQAAIAIAMKKAGKKPKSMKRGGRAKKVKPIQRASSIDFSSPYSGAIGKSKSRQVADRIYQANVTPEERLLGSELFQDSEGNFIRRTKLFSKAKKGMKFNPKYTRGSSNVGKRKKLMSEISNIYKQHRGTKAKRQKKGFPPAVAARLKQLMKQRDKI